MTRFASIFLLLTAIGQFLAPVLPALGVGETIGARAVDAGIPPELPTGPFFSIWGVIFLGYLALSGLALIRPTYRVQRITVPLALAGLGNIIWMISAQSIGAVWLDFLLLLPIAFFIWEAAYRLDRMGGFDGTGTALLMCLTIGLFAGWISVALSISVPDVARSLLGRGVSDHVWQSLWLALIPAAGLAWLFASCISRSLWYFVALGWGLTGIIVNNGFRLELHGLAIAAAVVGVLIVLRRLRFGASGSQPSGL